MFPRVKTKGKSINLEILVVHIAFSLLSYFLLLHISLASGGGVVVAAVKKGSKNGKRRQKRKYVAIQRSKVSLVGFRKKKREQMH